MSSDLGGFPVPRRPGWRRLGHGVRPSVASIGDLARMLAALAREQDLAPLRMLRRLVELEPELSRGRSIGR